MQPNTFLLHPPHTLFSPTRNLSRDQFWFFLLLQRTYNYSNFQSNLREYIYQPVTLASMEPVPAVTLCQQVLATGLDGFT